MPSAQYTPWLRPKNAAMPTKTPQTKWRRVLGCSSRRTAKYTAIIEMLDSKTLWRGNIQTASTAPMGSRNQMLPLTRRATSSAQKSPNPWKIAIESRRAMMPVPNSHDQAAP